MFRRIEHRSDLRAVSMSVSGRRHLGGRGEREGEAKCGCTCLKLCAARVRSARARTGNRDEGWGRDGNGDGDGVAAADLIHEILELDLSRRDVGPPSRRRPGFM